MPFESFINKFSDKKEVLTLNDFQQQLDFFISEIEQKYEESTAAEREYQELYDKKLSKLDFSGSKKAVEDGRHQLTVSLDLDVQLEFLKNIRSLSIKIPEKSIHSPKQKNKFIQIVKQIFDHKKISSQVGRRLILKRFMTFIPLPDDSKSQDIISKDSVIDDDVERILKEVREGSVKSDSIDNEVEKILEEIKNKKRLD